MSIVNNRVKMNREDFVELTIEDISAEGQGIGRVDGIGEDTGKIGGISTARGSLVRSGQGLF